MEFSVIDITSWADLLKIYLHLMLLPVVLLGNKINCRTPCGITSTNKRIKNKIRVKEGIFISTSYLFFKFYQRNLPSFTSSHKEQLSIA